MLLYGALLLLLGSPSTPQPCPQRRVDDVVSSVKKLYVENHWNEVIALAVDLPQAPADLDYYRGMALARLQRWKEARQAFATGQRKQPLDKRFPLELAGVAFKEQKFSEAESHLRRALRLDPKDAYAINFLASLYLLDGNLEAALREWNRIEKPEIVEIRFEPQPSVNPVLLDRAFTFSPASILRLDEYRTTRSQLALLGIFPSFRFELVPRPAAEGKESQTFDLLFRSTERDGWGQNRMEGLISLLRGTPYQTVYPEFYNLRHGAMNVTSLVRWDAQKRRLSASLAAPLKGNPQWRYEFHFDGRNEIWDLSQTFHSLGPPLDNLTVETARAGADIHEIISGRFDWTSGVDLTFRKFRNRDVGGLLAGPYFSSGVGIEYQAGLNYKLLDLPERRLTVETNASGQLGRLLVRSAGPFARLESSLAIHWLPQARGDDYEMTSQFRAGKTLGPVPFDELFILGLERDNDLWLGAHVGTSQGRKGSAPLGRDYLLSNSEMDKKLYDGGLLELRLGPFLDNGEIYDDSGAFGSRQWLWDAGGRLKIRILDSVAVTVSYGKDLRTGRDAFYFLVGR
jgi:tetratricopeptide repeat protein